MLPFFIFTVNYAEGMPLAQIPVLTPKQVRGRLNRNGIQRLVREGKQAHLCEALGQQSLMGRCRRDRMKEYVLTWGDLEPYELWIEKSAEVIVVNRMSRHRKGKVGILTALMKD